MESINVLGSVAETVIWLPEDADSENETDAFDSSMFTPPSLQGRDLRDGPQLRMEAFQRAWRKTYRRLKEIRRELRGPTLAKAEEAIRSAYTKTSPLLLNTELPVVAIAGLDRNSASQTFRDLRRALGEFDSDEMSVDGKDTSSFLTATVSASECTNMASAMKSIINEFVYPDSDGDDAESRARFEMPKKLSQGNIKVIEAWYHALKNDTRDNKPPKLVLFIIDFEKIDHKIMQDVLYVLSKYVPQLPFVVVISLSSPHMPSFIHSVYPRSTLAFLQLNRIVVEGGLQEAEILIKKTYFDTRFEPSVMLGPSSIAYIAGQLTRYTVQYDFLVNLLQLMLMRHFTEPLSAFVHDELLGENSLETTARKLSAPSHKAFLRCVESRTLSDQGKLIDSPRVISSASEKTFTIREMSDSVPKNVPKILRKIGTMRQAHIERLRKLKASFLVFQLVRDFMLERGYQSADFGKSDLDLMSLCLSGQLAGVEGTRLCLMVKKLKLEESQQLLQDLHSFFHNQPSHVREINSALRLKMVVWLNELSTLYASPAENKSERHKEIAREMAESIQSLFLGGMSSYRDTQMWDIWYTSNPSRLTSLINPSLLPTIISALLHPDQYLGDDISGLDMAILFRRYQEGGRLLNVYDWFEAFASTVEADRMDPIVVEKQGPEESDSHSMETPKKRRGRPPKGSSSSKKPDAKGGKKEVQKTPQEIEADDEQILSPSQVGEEEWRRIVLVRFLRSVQELDYMGFIRHGGRKAEHVQKIVFDVSE